VGVQPNHPPPARGPRARPRQPPARGPAEPSAVSTPAVTGRVRYSVGFGVHAGRPSRAHA
jgi:hypothetical protein